MNILKIVYGGDEGGVFNCECQYIRELIKNNVNVSLVIVGGGRNVDVYSNLVKSSIFINDFDFDLKGNGFKKIIKLLKIKYRSKSIVDTIVKTKIENTSFDAIIFRRNLFMYLSFYFSKKIGIKKQFWHMPSDVKNKNLVRIYSSLLKKLNVEAIANSEYTKESLGSICKYVLYPGFDWGRTSRDFFGTNFATEFNISSNTIVFGIASRICQVKAQDLVVKVLMDKEFRDKDFVLLLAGIVQDSEIYELIKTYSGDFFGKKVIYVGNVDDMSKFYSSIDVLVNSGRDPEPFGISIAEALGSSLPIVASSTGGPAETVKEGFNGWTFKDFTYDGYKEVFRSVFKSLDMCEDYGKNSLIHSEKFTVKNNVSNLITIIKS